MTSVLNQGILATWKDDKGFGFIRPKNGGEDIFLHISELKDATRRPQEGDTIYYYVTTQDGKTRACNAFIAGARRKPNASTSNISSNQGSGAYVLQRNPFPILEVSLLSIFPTVSSIILLTATANPLPLVLYPVMSIAAFYVYANDKRRAKTNQRRIAEKTLHAYEILGGWIGGFAAQRCFRHKNKKKSYQLAFWIIVVAHYIAWIYWWLWFLFAS